MTVCWQERGLRPDGNAQTSPAANGERDLRRGPTIFDRNRLTRFAGYYPIQLSAASPARSASRGAPSPTIPQDSC